MTPEALGLGLSLGFFLFISALVLMNFALLAFWIWMLVDCAQSPEKPGSNDRLVWILVLIFTNWLGAIIYYFVVRRPRLAALAMHTRPPRFVAPPPFA